MSNKSTVWRVEKTENYTTMGNYHLKNENMSLSAKGLLSVILSLPDDWDYSESGLVAISKEGRFSIRSNLQELEMFGHLKREKIRDKGKFGGYKYTVYEKPITVKPITEEPTSDKHTQLSTKELSTKELSTKDINTYEHLEEWWQKFWTKYPRKVNKESARKSFERIVKTEDLLNIILKDLELRINTKEWQADNGKYILHPTTYLNGSRWQDEMGTPVKERRKGDEVKQVFS